MTVQLGEMCGMAGRALGFATQSLLLADLKLNQRVMVTHRAIAALSGHAKRTALLSPAWCRQPAAADTPAVLTALHTADDAEQMGALAVRVAAIARRRYPMRAVGDELAGRVIDMDSLAVGLAGQLCDVLLMRDGLHINVIRHDETRMDELHRRLLAVVRDSGRAQSAKPGVDANLLSQLYERFADHAVQIGRSIVG